MMVFGLHAVLAALENPSSELQGLSVVDGKLNRRQQRVVDRAASAGCPVTRVSRTDLDKLASGVHQGVVLHLAELSQTPASLEEILAEDRPDLALLLLDGVTDPRNLGACVRSAAAWGVDAVLVLSRRSAPVSAAAQKAASGGFARVPVVAVSNLARALKQIQQAGVWTVGLAGEGEETLASVDLTGRVALIMGSEGDGMRRLTRENCDHVTRLPTAQGASLNVSVAAGVALYEMARQRQS